MSVKLYSYWKSSCSWRVRTALALKGVEYEYIAVNILKKDDKMFTSSEFKGKSPMRQVPTLDVDGHCFTQSLPILEYLDEKFPGYKLFPDNLVEKTRVREVCEVINSGIQPLQNAVVLDDLPENERKTWGHRWVSRGFVALEKILEQTSGKYCVGDEVTAADIFLVPQVSNARIRFDVDMAQFPIISCIDGNLKDHQAFIAGHPKNQPDAPLK